jgi:hypothetical protein
MKIQAGMKWESATGGATVSRVVKLLSITGDPKVYRIATALTYAGSAPTEHDLSRELFDLVIQGMKRVPNEVAFDDTSPGTSTILVDGEKAGAIWLRYDTDGEPDIWAIATMNRIGQVLDSYVAIFPPDVSLAVVQDWCRAYFGMGIRGKIPAQVK